MFWFDICGWQLTEDQALKMVYTRRKEKAKGMNEFDAPLETNITDPMKYQPYVTATNQQFSEDDVLVEDNDEDKIEDVPEFHPSVLPKNTDRTDANTESPPRIQYEKIYLEYQLPVGQSSHQNRTIR